MRSRLMVGLVTAALVAVPLACGDDDDDGGLGGTSEVTESGASDTAADDTATDDTATDDTATDDTEGASGEEPTGGDLVRWCELTAELNDVNPFEGTEDPSPEAIEEAFDEYGDRAEEYLDSAPDQIADDAETVVQGFRDLSDIVEGHDWDLVAASQDPEFTELVSNPDFEEAGTRIDEFEDANCS